MAKMEVNIHEAKTHFSRLLQRVAAGEEITISRAGVPVARLVAIGPQSRTRPMGMDRGKVLVADDFEASDPDLERLFYDAPVTNSASRKKKRKT